MARNDHFAERFLATFALPLCEGGAVHVGAPLGLRGLLRLEAAAAAGLDTTEVGQRLSAARHRIMGDILLNVKPPLLAADSGAVAMLAALHDLLFLLHPGAQRALLGRGLSRLAAHVAHLAARAAPRVPQLEGDDALAALLAARHSLLHGLWTLSRDDVRVTFWAGRQEFHGMEPPPRLLLWRNLRRVQEERWRVICYLQVLGQPGGRGAFLALLRTSPLSDLLTPKRLDPPFDPLQHAPLLRILPLRRAVRAHYLQLGLAEVGGALGTSLLRLLGQAAARPVPPPRDHLLTVLGFACELLVCVLLGPAPPPPLAGDGALRDLVGLLCALCLRWPTLALPADVRGDVALMRALRAKLEGLCRAVGPQRLDEIIGLCARALGSAEPALPQPAAPAI